MNKTIGIIIGVVVVVVAGAALLYRGSSSTQPAATDAPQQSVAPVQSGASGLLQEAPSSSPLATTAPKVGATISITDTAFDPATITVAAGTTVAFTNNGQSTHWPASNPHPTHTDLPGFDSKHGLATGETFTFTFTKVGTWGFHDHFNPSWHGTVIVK